MIVKFQPPSIINFYDIQIEPFFIEIIILNKDLIKGKLDFLSIFKIITVIKKTILIIFISFSLYSIFFIS